jgi:hypothetical protein
VKISESNVVERTERKPLSPDGDEPGGDAGDDDDARSTMTDEIQINRKDPASLQLIEHYDNPARRWYV